VFTPGTEQCCGNNKYTLATQFCYNSNKIASFCGNRTQDLDKYDPDKYECRAATNPNGIYLKSDIEYDGKAYKAVLIGEQTWMAENLNYKTSDGASRCYPTSGDTNNSDTDNANCTTYGRLYNWATAMDFDANCNTIFCTSQINAKHRGICPSGWHVSSNEDWNTLMKYVNPSCSDINNCADAGTKLKAKSSWNTGNGYIPCTDEFGFSALPGGLGRSDGSFGNAGYNGGWWSATESYVSSYAYYQYMGYSNANVGRSHYDKAYLYSVRCVQD
jgi:uncharacterized protein (TIGR02145 family)